MVERTQHAIGRGSALIRRWASLLCQALILYSHGVVQQAKSGQLAFLVSFEKHIMRMRKKADLPQKICVQCGLSFTWRKKWQRVWDEVKYCSDRCRHTPSPKSPRH